MSYGLPLQRLLRTLAGRLWRFRLRAQDRRIFRSLAALSALAASTFVAPACVGADRAARRSRRRRRSGGSSTRSESGASTGPTRSPASAPSSPCRAGSRGSPAYAAGRPRHRPRRRRPRRRRSRPRRLRAGLRRVGGDFPILRFTLPEGEVLGEVARLERTAKVQIRWRGDVVATGAYPVPASPIISNSPDGWFFELSEGS